jgi:hypothetical protein
MPPTADEIRDRYRRTGDGAEHDPGIAQVEPDPEPEPMGTLATDARPSAQGDPGLMAELIDNVVGRKRGAAKALKARIEEGRIEVGVDHSRNICLLRWRDDATGEALDPVVIVTPESMPKAVVRALKWVESRTLHPARPGNGPGVSALVDLDHAFRGDGGAERRVIQRIKVGTIEARIQEGRLGIVTFTDTISQGRRTRSMVDLSAPMRAAVKTGATLVRGRRGSA